MDYLTNAFGSISGYLVSNFLNPYCWFGFGYCESTNYVDPLVCETVAAEPSVETSGPSYYFTPPYFAPAASVRDDTSKEGTWPFAISLEAGDCSMTFNINQMIQTSIASFVGAVTASVVLYLTWRKYFPGYSKKTSKAKYCGSGSATSFFQDHRLDPKFNGGKAGSQSLQQKSDDNNNLYSSYEDGDIDYDNLCMLDALGRPDLASRIYFPKQEQPSQPQFTTLPQRQVEVQESMRNERFHQKLQKKQPFEVVTYEQATKGVQCKISKSGITETQIPGPAPQVQVVPVVARAPVSKPAAPDSDSRRIRFRTSTTTGGTTDVPKPVSAIVVPRNESAPVVPANVKPSPKPSPVTSAPTTTQPSLPPPDRVPSTPKLELHQYPRGERIPCENPLGMKLESLLRMFKTPYKVIFDYAPTDPTGPTLICQPLNNVGSISNEQQSKSLRLIGKEECLIEFLCDNFPESRELLNSVRIHRKKKVPTHFLKTLIQFHLLPAFCRWRVVELQEIKTGSNLNSNSDKSTVFATHSENFKKSGNEFAATLEQMSPKELVAALETDLSSLAASLAEKTYFIGENMTHIDCAVFAILCQMVWDYEDSTCRRLIYRCPNLVKHSFHMQTILWPDWETQLKPQPDYRKELQLVFPTGSEFKTPQPQQPKPSGSGVVAGRVVPTTESVSGSGTEHGTDKRPVVTGAQHLQQQRQQQYKSRYRVGDSSNASDSRKLGKGISSGSNSKLSSLTAAAVDDQNDRMPFQYQIQACSYKYY